MVDLETRVRYITQGDGGDRGWVGDRCELALTPDQVVALLCALRIAVRFPQFGSADRVGLLGLSAKLDAWLSGLEVGDGNRR